LCGQAFGVILLIAFAAKSFDHYLRGLRLKPFRQSVGAGMNILKANQFLTVIAEKVSMIQANSIVVLTFIKRILNQQFINYNPV
jgi:hypothetical protein